jgi:purine-nucleoside phosphorylase
LTNAAGGLTDKAKTGSLVAISDHLNLTHQNIAASSHPTQPVRFMDMANAYDQQWRQHVTNQTNIMTGVYAGMLGPTFETPAESNMLRTLGADLVGMSTVQETIAARLCDMKVFACSVITNQAGATGSDHASVLKLVESNARVITSVLEKAASYP